MTYYKATRIDGTSFCDKKTKWKIGNVTRAKNNTRRTKLHGSGILYASDAPGEALEGQKSRWPCCLFEVVPEEPIVTQKNHKVGAHAWLVIKDLPAWQALGPNGQEVASFIERCAVLMPDEIRALVRERTKEKYRGYSVIVMWPLIAIRDTAHAHAREGAMNAVIKAAPRAVQNAARGTKLDIDPDATFNIPWGITSDVAAALVVRDLIDEGHFEALCRPWYEAIGERI